MIGQNSYTQCCLKVHNNLMLLYPQSKESTAPKKINTFTPWYLIGNTERGSVGQGKELQGHADNLCHVHKGWSCSIHRLRGPFQQHRSWCIFTHLMQTASHIRRAARRNGVLDATTERVAQQTIKKFQFKMNRRILKSCCNWIWRESLQDWDYVGNICTLSAHKLPMFLVYH